MHAFHNSPNHSYIFRLHIYVSVSSDLSWGLQDRDPRSYQILLQQPGGACFLGSTPEQLYIRTGTAVASEAVAATRPRGPPGCYPFPCVQYVQFALVVENQYNVVSLVQQLLLISIPAAHGGPMPALHSTLAVPILSCEHQKAPAVLHGHLLLLRLQQHRCSAWSCVH